MRNRSAAMKTEELKERMSSLPGNKMEHCQIRSPTYCLKPRGSCRRKLPFYKISFCCSAAIAVSNYFDTLTIVTISIDGSLNIVLFVIPEQVWFDLRTGSRRGGQAGNIEKRSAQTFTSYCHSFLSTRVAIT